MSGDDFAHAMTTGGEAWLVLSLAAVLPILWAFTLTLHFARPYMLRFLQSLTLRFGGDVWWLGYVLMRDGLMLITLVLSITFLFPNLYIGLGLPLTAPLAAVVLFWALAYKFMSDTDDNPRAFQIESIMLVIASALYIIPQIYGLEAADQVDALSPVGLGWVPGVLVAQTEEGVNGLAWPILAFSLVLFALTGAFLFTRFLIGIGKETDAEEASAA
jgi:hypothetical protein